MNIAIASQLIPSDYKPNRASKTYEAASLLIDVCEEVQDMAVNSHPRGIDFAKDFCTVKVATSRRGGHSTAIVQLCKRFKSSIVFSVANAQSAILKNEFSRNDIRKHDITFVTPYDLRQLSGRQCEAVFCDCPSSFSTSRRTAPSDNNEVIESIYTHCFPMMMRNKRMYFIFVG